MNNVFDFSTSDLGAFKDWKFQIWFRYSNQLHMQSFIEDKIKYYYFPEITTNDTIDWRTYYLPDDLKLYCEKLVKNRILL